jgi:hypothetical protein
MSTDDTREALEVPTVHARSHRHRTAGREVFAYWRARESSTRDVAPRVGDRPAAGDPLDRKEGPAGVRVEWDAEIINDIEPELIAWRSLPGSEVVSAGSVHFEPAGPDQTELVVTLQYAPPAGRVGALGAKLFGREPSQTIHDDLRQFKQALEDGQLADLSSSGETVTER